MLSSFEYELFNKEYIRCLKLINEYTKRNQKCIIFKLRSFECLISRNMYETVLNELIKQLQKDNYDVYCSGSELLIFWDQRGSPIINDEQTHPPCIKEVKSVAKKKKKDEETIKIDHINMQFGDYVDEFPIKTGEY